MTNNQKLWGLILFIAMCFLTAGLGAALTSVSIKGWYTTIEKPSFTPPNWVFPVAWNTLYLLLSFAGWTLWKTLSGQWKNLPLILFVSQLILNVAWSCLFFTLQNPMGAFIEICVTVLLAYYTLYLFYLRSKLAGIFMTPYVLWLSFAVVLNYSIWQLN